MKRKIYREDIKNAGRDIMFEKGYAATGIKDITDDIQIPKGSFYNHFDSKEAFGLEILQDYAENGARMYEKALSDTTVTPLQRLKNMFETIADQYRGSMNFKFGCLMSNFSTELADVNEAFREALETGFEAHQEEIIKCLREAQGGGEIRSDLDVEEAGRFMLNSWHGAFVRMKSSANDQPFVDFQHQVFGNLLA